MKYDVVIVGGGIIGAASAFELSQQGARVVVLEKNHVGFGASGASAAMLEFQTDAFRGEPFYSLAKASLALFPALYKEVMELTDIDFQYENCGILQLALNADDVSVLQAEVASQKKRGLRLEWLDQSSIQKEWPQLSPSILGGALFQEDGQVNAEKFIRGLMKAAVVKGADLKQGFQQVSLKVEGGRVTGVETDQESFEAPTIVVAAGAWTDHLLKPLDIQLGLEPLKGQLVVFDTPESVLPLPVYTRARGYITPKKDGYTFAGSTVERAGFDATSTAQATYFLAEQAYELLPSLQGKTIRTTIAGLRPGSPDELPFLGWLAGHTNVIVAAGHYRNGILLAPITGKVVAELALQRPPSINIQPFSPARVQPRPLIPP